MAVRHAYTDLDGDYNNTQIVKPSQWNESHNVSPFLVAFFGEAQPSQWFDQPAALTPLFGDANIGLFPNVDLTYANQIRIIVNIVERMASGGTVRLQCSLDGVNWFYPNAETSGPFVAASLYGAYASPWLNIDEAMKAIVSLRFVGVGGNLNMDPKFGCLYAYIR